MSGPEEVLKSFSNADKASYGVMPRAIQSVLDGLRGESASVTASYIELYNGKVNDLLSGEKNLPMQAGKIKVRLSTRNSSSSSISRDDGIL